MSSRFLCLVGLAAFAAAATAEPRSLGGKPESSVYLEIYRAAVERRMSDGANRKRNTKADISAACAAWMLGTATGDVRYQKFAAEAYDRFLKEKVDHDFHLSRPFGMMTIEMHQAGMLTGERRSLAKRQAIERITWFLDQRKENDDYFDCNIALADTLAVACLARAFGDDPAVRAREIRDKVSGLGKRLLATGDLNENASNYSSLGICFFLELAEMEGWIDDVARSEHFRNMFVRMRDIISPIGSIPEYGDGYFRHREVRLDFVLLLETAARLYDDASFQKAAATFLLAPPAIEDDQLHRAFVLISLKPFTPTRETRQAVSAVQTRRVPDSPVKAVPDKLILRTGLKPGDAMVMLDLYALGSHAHEYKRPSIGYYEVGGVPLFHNLGRRGTRSGQCGNSFWVMDQADAFPGYPKENVWNTMRVPANYCFATAEKDIYRIGDSLIFRNFRTPGLKFLRFDNLRLEGPKGTLLLDGFESPKTWHSNVAGNPKVKLESSLDHTQGDVSQQVNWSVFGEQYCTRRFEQKAVWEKTFSIADYDCVKLDYKYEGQHPRCNLRSLFDRWIDLGDRPLHCEVARAEVGQIDRDAWGCIEFASYIQPGSSLKRQLILTNEGALVIVDRFAAGPRCEAGAAGQLWQLYAMSERGADWFASESDGPYALPDGAKAERRMLVKFMKTPGVSVDAERVQPSTMHAPKADGSPHRTYVTTYSKQRISPGKNVLAAMAVLPLKRDDNAAEQANWIAFEPGDSSSLGVSIRATRTQPAVLVRFASGSITVDRNGKGK